MYGKNLSGGFGSNDFLADLLTEVEQIGQQVDESKIMSTLTNELLATMHPSHAAQVQTELDRIATTWPKRSDVTPLTSHFLNLLWNRYHNATTGRWAAPECPFTLPPDVAEALLSCDEDSGVVGVFECRSCHYRCIGIGQEDAHGFMRECPACGHTSKPVHPSAPPPEAAAA